MRVVLYLLQTCIDSFSYPVAPIVLSAGGIVQFIYLLFAEPITNSVKKTTGFLIYEQGL